MRKTFDEIDSLSTHEYLRYLVNMTSDEHDEYREEWLIKIDERFGPRFGQWASETYTMAEESNNQREVLDIEVPSSEKNICKNRL